ncbi:MAG: glycerate kinase [Bacteroidota bacterium]
MKFVLAPDKFKGSLTGDEFCVAAEIGIKKAFPNAKVLKKPLADGGDGTMEVVKKYVKAKEIKVKVHDPLFREIEAEYLFSDKKATAFIEMSRASGYRLLARNELNCMKTTSMGTGELIVDALRRGAREIVLGIGGSATTDGGMGVAHALGYRFLDKRGNYLQPIGQHLAEVATIDTKQVVCDLTGVSVSIACDVENPFHGKNGAAHVYARQKGASKNEVLLLDRGLQSFAQVLHSHFQLDVQQEPGSGAAGGLGGGAMAFLNAKLVSGIDLIKDMANFEAAIKDANWIITGEGKLDVQTFSGKTISGVVEAARGKAAAVAAFCGIVDLSLEEQEALGLTYSTSILRNFQDVKEAKRSSKENLIFSIYNFCQVLKKDMTVH